MDDIDPSELPDYDDVANMVSVDEIDQKDANNTELQKLQNTEGPKQTETRKKPISESRKVALKKLKSMGYTDMIASNALNAINDYAPNNTAMAVEWIMDHPQETNQKTDGNNTTTNNNNNNTLTTTEMPPRAVSDLINGPNSTKKKKIEPMEIENDGNTTNNNNNNNNNNAAANGEGNDYKERCNECMDNTKIFCGDCWLNTSDKYNNMNQTEKYVFWGSWASLCCIGVLLTIILIPISIRKVEFDEYAIKYDDLTKQEDSEEYGEGRYIFTPKTKLFVYDALIQKLSLDLDCLTKDGIEMDIEVDIQYSIPKISVYDIWNEFGKEDQIDKYFALVASDAVRDSISTFHASDFYRNRFGIQLAIEDALYQTTEEANTHLLVVSAVLAGYTYPEELKEVIKIKRSIENDIEVAKNERDGNLTDADTNYHVAKIAAQRLYLQGQAEVKSLLAEATAHANAVTARFDALTSLFVAQANATGLNGKQFIDYWLTSFILLDATRPITTIRFDENCCQPSGPINTPSPVNINQTVPTIMTTAAAQTTQYFTSLAPSIAPVIP